MIIGIGSDLCDMRRIAESLERFGERFQRRVFTEVERAHADRRRANPDAWAGTYAKRFAAKEACAKALGTGMRRGVFWRDMGVINQRSGRPTLVLTGGAAERLAAMTPPGHTAAIHLSLTDEVPYAEAFVIIEALTAAELGVPLPR